jgi:NAD-dependent DNA ligase
MSKSLKEFFSLYKQNKDWVEFLKELSQEELKELILELSNLYYNKQSEVDDKDFDYIKEFYEAKFNEKIPVGAKPIKNKVDLPYHIGSLRKLNPSQISSWKKKFSGPYLIEDKIDGLSLIFVSEEKGSRSFLFTRGDGKTGSDVSHLLEYIQGIPKSLDRDLVVRGECVVKKKDFERTEEFKNARSMASGIVNRSKELDVSQNSLLHFFAFKILSEENKPSDDLRILKELGFSVPFFELVEDFDQTYLRSLLSKRDSEAEYNIDGLVIYDDKVHSDVFEDEPKSIFSFKKSSHLANTKVKEILWNVTKGNKLVPTLLVEPVEFEDSTTNRVNIYNAKFLLDNQIGPGAIIAVERIGGANTRFVSVVKPSNPVFPDINYTWDDSNTNLILAENNNQVDSLKLVHTLKAFNVKGAGKSNAQKFIEAGIDFFDLLVLGVEEISRRTKIGLGTVGKIKEELLKAVLDADLVTLMNASNLFDSLGPKRLKTIVDELGFQRILRQENNIDLQEVKEIRGIKNLAENFLNGLKEFKGWLSKLISILPKMKIASSFFGSAKVRQSSIKIKKSRSQS